MQIMLPCMPEGGDILDLGCGHGDLAASLMKARPALRFTGLDVYPLENSLIPRQLYDGVTIPYPDAHFDYVMLVTMLHHTDDYVPVLKEACRVARKGLLVFDHQYFNRLDWATLAVIDWPGNVPFGVYTPFNFKTRAEWLQLFRSLRIKEVYHSDRVFLYGKILDFLFGRRLHFVSALAKESVTELEGAV